MKYFWQSVNILLTDNLKGEWCLVLEVIHLHAHLIHSRVVSLGCTDEQDTVSLGAADVHPLCVQGLAILCPADHRFGFALCFKKKKIKIKDVRQWILRSYVVLLRYDHPQLTVKGMVRLILSPTLATYLCLRKRGRRTLGRSTEREKNNQSKQSMTTTVNQHLGIFYSPLLLVPKGIRRREDAAGKKGCQCMLREDFVFFCDPQIWRKSINLLSSSKLHLSQGIFPGAIRVHLCFDWL